MEKLYIPLSGAWSFLHVSRWLIMLAHNPSILQEDTTKATRALCRVTNTSKPVWVQLDGATPQRAASTTIGGRYTYRAGTKFGDIPSGYDIQAKDGPGLENHSWWKVERQYGRKRHEVFLRKTNHAYKLGDHVTFMAQKSNRRLSNHANQEDDSQERRYYDLTMHYEDFILLMQGGHRFMELEHLFK